MTSSSYDQVDSPLSEHRADLDRGRRYDRYSHQQHTAADQAVSSDRADSRVKRSTESIGYSDNQRARPTQLSSNYDQVRSSDPHRPGAAISDRPSATSDLQRPGEPGRGGAKNMSRIPLSPSMIER